MWIESGYVLRTPQIRFNTSLVTVVELSSKIMSLWPNNETGDYFQYARQLNNITILNYAAGV
jgi:hypothetical protein